MEGAIAEPTRVEEVAEVMQDASSPHEDGPITPAKGPAPAKVAAAAAEREHQAAGGPDAAALAPGSEECTPEKEKQGAGKPQRSVGGEALSPAEVQAQACQQLYYGVLRAVFKQMDLYASGSADLLDPRKQLLVYHHAARVFEFRKIVMTVLRGEPDDTKLAELPVTYRSAIKGFRREAAESGSLPAPESIREKMVFGHEGVIKLVEPPVVPVGAKKSCILLREKPHAMTDNVKHISAFRDAIKFKCNQNPLTLIDEHGLGLVLMVEGTTPKAFIIVSPFLTEPAGLEALCAKERVGMTHLEKALGTQVVEFIAKETDGWRTFIQRRANILSKGSRVAIEKVLRSRNRIADGAAAPAAAAEGMVEAMEELKEELETARSRAKQAEKALERTESLESKLKKTEKKLAEYKKLQDRHVSSEELENTLKAATTSRKRPSAEDDEEEEEPRVVQVTDSKLEGKLRKVGKKLAKCRAEEERLRLELEKTGEAVEQKDEALEEKAKEISMLETRVEAAEKLLIEQKDLRNLKERCEARVKEAEEKAAVALLKAADADLLEVASNEKVGEMRRELNTAIDSNQELLHEVAVANISRLQAKQREQAMATKLQDREAKKIVAREAQVEGEAACKELEEVAIKKAAAKSDEREEKKMAAREAKVAEREAACKAAVKKAEAKLADRETKFAERLTAFKAETSSAKKEIEEAASKKAEAKFGEREAKLTQQLADAQALAKAKADEALHAVQQAASVKLEETKARTELALKVYESEATRRVNVELRTKVAEAEEQVKKVAEHKAGAEKKVADAEKKVAQAFAEKDRISADLVAAGEEQKKQDTVLRAQIADASAAAKAVEGRVEEAQRFAAEARGAEVRAASALKLKEKELDAMRAFADGMLKEAKDARQVHEQFAGLKAEVSASKAEEGKVRAELVQKCWEAEHVRKANVDLRASEAAAKVDLASLQDRVDKAEHAATEARAREQEQRDEVRVREREVEEWKQKEQTARAAISAAEARVAKEAAKDAEVELRMVIAREAELAARASEAKARAEAEVKVKELAALKSFAASLQADLQREQKARYVAEAKAQESAKRDNELAILRDEKVELNQSEKLAQIKLEAASAAVKSLVTTCRALRDRLEAKEREEPEAEEKSSDAEASTEEPSADDAAAEAPPSGGEASDAAAGEALEELNQVCAEVDEAVSAEDDALFNEVWGAVEAVPAAVEAATAEAEDAEAEDAEAEAEAEAAEGEEPPTAVVTQDEPTTPSKRKADASLDADEAADAVAEAEAEAEAEAQAAEGEEPPMAVVTQDDEPTSPSKRKADASPDADEAGSCPKPTPSAIAMSATPVPLRRRVRTKTAEVQDQE